MLLWSQILFVTGALALAGALVFDAVVTPRALAGLRPAEDTVIRHALRRWSAACVAATLLGLLAWTLAETASMAGTTDLPATLAESGTVLTDTLFGRVALLQFAALAFTALLLAAHRGRLALAPSLLCVAAQAAHGHGMAIGGPFGPLFALDVLHLLAASVWIGGLVPLLLVVARGPARAGALAARWFSPIGRWAVLLLLACAVLQAAGLVGTPHALVATAYGRAVLAKATLFSVLLGFALLNRYRLAPALRAPHPDASRRLLLQSIAAQSLVAALTVAVAAYLGSLPPSVEHAS